MYIKSEKRREMLFLGFLGMVLFAVGDVLLQSFPAEGEILLVMLRTSIREMPMGRLYFTLLTGIPAAPCMYFGLCAMDSCLRDRLKEEKGKMYRCFQIGAVIGMLSFFAAHAVCAVLEMSIKQALESGLSSETVHAVYRTPFLVAFAATNLWVTVAEICLSVAYIFFILKGVLPLPKAAVVWNTAGVFLIFHIAGAVLTGITGNGAFSLLAKAGASLGVGAMFLAVAYVCGKETR